MMSRKYDTPFDNAKNRRSYNEVPSAMHVRPARYMSTRGSLFLGFALVSLCIEFLYSNNIWWPAVCSLVVLAVWSISFRLFLPRKYAALTLLIVIGMFCAACEVSVRLGLCSPVSVCGFVPFAIGVMMLSRFKRDGEDEFRPAETVREIAVPYLYALGSSLSGFLVSEVFEKQYIFISTLIAAMMLVFISYFVSKISSSPLYFTSRELTEFWNIPVSDIEELRRFVIARIEFAVTCAGVIVGVISVSGFIRSDIASWLVLPVAEVISCGLGILIISGGRGGDSKSVFGTRYFLSETSVAAALLTVPFIRSLPEMPSISGIVGLFMFTVFGDILVSGLLAVVRRRLIFVRKSRFIDGLPFYLIMLSLVLMLFETCLYRIPGL